MKKAAAPLLVLIVAACGPSPEQAALDEALSRFETELSTGLSKARFHELRVESMNALKRYTEARRREIPATAKFIEHTAAIDEGWAELFGSSCRGSMSEWDNSCIRAVVEPMRKSGMQFDMPPSTKLAISLGLSGVGNDIAEIRQVTRK